ncbi:UDP-N-acetylmuramoyl-L-alanine--D-glutamate ligase [bacterium]|nr:UDP-N-acetylmuramoyl-L-alanine--D-glutamate ligase [bacterium]
MKKKLEKIFNNKKIAILGLGLENLSILKLLDKYKIKVNIAICDFRDLKSVEKILKKNNLNKKNYKYQLEEKFNNNLFIFDTLYRSPGWSLSCPGIKETKFKKNEKGEKTKISSAMNLFFSLCPSKNIIGVTGSKGKGTTATLITKIIEENNKNVFLGGNIGIAPISFIEKIEKNDFIVLELSSFQLEDLKYSPKISILTNIYNEHLSPADPKNPNYHKNIETYLKAKLNIIKKHKNNKNYFITSNKVIKKIEKILPETITKYPGTIIKYKKSKLDNNLAGEYNKENIGACWEVAKILKIDNKKSKKTLKNFSNLEHRLEFVKNINNLKYYNNSFSTTPESTILDIKSFKKPLVLIAGGADKGADFKALAKEIKENVKYLILFPGLGSEKIKKELEKINYSKIHLSKNMSEAVSFSLKTIKSGTILLSPACASFGLFKNYKERGNLFKKEVNKRNK